MYVEVIWIANDVTDIVGIHTMQIVKYVSLFYRVYLRFVSEVNLKIALMKAH